ncbi:hypothetical protein LPC08_18200 [Roseomonas sp. OT10]|uniref:DUF5681 domain-containing protein n=1 Tax=Roseomonas cutis TaxID=2897332 RepID=UPI001E5F035D|nr:DUF5681 domain-containing protein [Roseomonas sp. OT10]UFN47929.1 hypothetical protein LPC08_18200 [Roseomonas sp. OT10]
MAKTSKPANPLLNTGEQAEGVPGRKPDGRFLPGHSGNPGGRPKGARSRLNRMAEDFALTNGEGLLAIAYGMCLDRDAATLRLLLERIFPAKDWCPEPEPDLILGPLETVEDIKSASGRVIAAYRSGGVTSADVGKLHRVLAARLSIIAPGAKPPITLVDAGEA